MSWYIFNNADSEEIEVAVCDKDGNDYSSVQLPHQDRSRRQREMKWEADADGEKSTVHPYRRRLQKDPLSTSSQNNQTEYRGKKKISVSFIYTHIKNALKDMPPGIRWTFIDLPLAARQVQIKNLKNS